MLQVPGLGPHGLRMYHPSKDFKSVWGELRECGPTLYWHQPQQPTVGPQHFLSDPKPTILNVAKKKGWPEVTPVLFLNPDTITHLVGCSNEAPVTVDGQEMTALIDFGCSGIQCELPVLQRSCTTNPTIGSVIIARGDRGFSHPIPWVCRGQPPDPRDQKL